MNSASRGKLVYCNADHSIVLGLHAHFDPAFHARIVACLRAAKLCGLNTGYLGEDEGPHMTMGSWQRHGISPEIVDRFEEGLTGLGTYPVQLKLGIYHDNHDDQYCASFSPRPTPGLLTYHRTVNRRITRVGRRYRRCDVPGAWVPHSGVLWFRRASEFPKYMKLLSALDKSVDTFITGFSVVCYGLWPRRTLLKLDLLKGRTTQRLSLADLVGVKPRPALQRAK